MSKRKKIENIEESEEEIEEEEIEEEIDEIKDNEVEEENKVSTREEGIVIEEELEKEMKERLKEREAKEKLAYEENRIKRWYMNNKENVRLMIYSFFLFLMLSIGIIAAFALYAVLGITTQELVLIICTTLMILGAVIFIYIGQKYLLK